MKFEGVLAITDLHQYQLEVDGSEHYPNIKYAILDYLNCDFSNIHTKDLDSIFARSIGQSYSNPYLKVAIVATDKHTISVNEFYKSRLEDFKKEWQFEIFPTASEARNWLDPTSRWT